MKIFVSINVLFVAFAYIYIYIYTHLNVEVLSLKKCTYENFQKVHFEPVAVIKTGQFGILLNHKSFSLVVNLTDMAHSSSEVGEPDGKYFDVAILCLSYSSPQLQGPSSNK